MPCNRPHFHTSSWGSEIRIGIVTVAEELDEVLCAHKLPQFAAHDDCEHDVLSGQVHFSMLCSASPNVSPIAANSSIIDIVANFFIKHHHSSFRELKSRTK